MIQRLIVPLVLMLVLAPVQASNYFANAPCWVLSTACVKAKVAGVGLSHIRYQDNAQLATLQAKRDAIASAAMMAKVKVNSQVDQQRTKYHYRNSTHWQQTTKQSSLQLSHLQLTGLTVQEKWLDRKGILYILVVVEQFDDITNKNAVKNGDNDQGAQWLTRVGSRSDAIDEVSTNIADHPVIKSNMEYANQLSQSIRQEIQILNF